MRGLLTSIALLLLLTCGRIYNCFAQNIPTPGGVSICDDPRSRGTAAYMRYCGACYPRCGAAAPSNEDSDAANRAQAAAAAAEAERQRQAELDQQRVDADNRRRMEEIQYQAKFIDDRNAAASTLRSSTGVSSSGSFGAPQLRGSGATPQLRGSASPTIPAPTVDSHFVDARNVPTGLPKSVASEIPHSPAGDRVRKGFQAITAHDWNAAHAWFQDALLHDSGNAGLQRLVDFAEFNLTNNVRSLPVRATHPTPQSPTQAPPQPDLSIEAVNKQMTAQMNADDSEKLRSSKSLDTQMDTQMNAADMATLRGSHDLDLRMDEQMNSDLARSLARFNQYYESIGPSPAIKVSTNATSHAEWAPFLKSLFTPPPRVLIPTSVAGVRD